MKNSHQYLFILLFFGSIANLSSQTLPSDNTFFNPIYGAGSITISESVGTGDDTAIFQNAIDALTTDGGTLIVNAGTYRILEVDLKSNVHLEINSSTTFLPFNPSSSVNNALFNADLNAGIDNFSLIGVGGKFTVDMSSLETTIRIRVVAFGNCTNFKVGNFHIIDGVTEFSSLAFGGNFVKSTIDGNKRITSVRGVPNFGIIEDVSMVNGHYGYGLVQIQGGNNILFRGLNCDGGVALRLETGYDLIQYTEAYDFDLIKLDNIWGRNIECSNGQSALQLSPHTLDQGYFNVSGVTATSCEAAVVWSSGFTTDDQEAAGLTPGSFDSTSKVRDVTSTFGQNAQLHNSKRLRYIPCALRVERVGGIGIATALNIDGECRMGPAIASVLRQELSPGDYDLDFPISEVTAIGYNIEAYYLPPKAFIINSYDDYEVCDESIDGLNFWVPAAYRNTPNPRNPLENGSLSVSDFDSLEFNVYPNPTKGILNIDFNNNSEVRTVKIFNLLGNEVGNFEVKNNDNIDLSHLTKGVYFLCNENQIRKKIILF